MVSLTKAVAVMLLTLGCILKEEQQDLLMD